MTTQPPWAGRDILDRLRGATFDSVSAEDLADAVAEIERLRAKAGESVPAAQWRQRTDGTWAARDSGGYEWTYEPEAVSES